LDILYEDPHMLVVNKPSGVLVHPGDESDVDTMAHRVVAYFAEAGLARRARHVHRLDRDTTGALLYAKHEFAARSFDRLLQGHEIARRYVALVAGEMPRLRGTIREPIGRDRHVSGRYRVSRTGKLAVTHYRVLASTRIGADAVSLVECVLETGRTHQIRVHLSAAGCPVVGDVLYGGGRGIGGIPFPEGYALHAWQLTLWHPYTEQEVCVPAPFPRLFVDVVRQLSMEVSLDALQVEAR
jgi:23S rRNA pseudouridine1911/1915/1917 synthase